MHRKKDSDLLPADTELERTVFYILGHKQKERVPAYTSTMPFP